MSEHFHDIHLYLHPDQQLFLTYIDLDGELRRTVIRSGAKYPERGQEQIPQFKPGVHRANDPIRKTDVTSAYIDFDSIVTALEAMTKEPDFTDSARLANLEREVAAIRREMDEIESVVTDPQNGYELPEEIKDLENSGEFMVIEKAAEYLDVSGSALCKWAKKGVGPDNVKIKNRRYYRKSELDRFKKSKKYQTAMIRSKAKRLGDQRRAAK